jgi:hypothetical protein
VSGSKCPICFGTNLSIERRPDGDAQCMDCNWLDKYELCFESKEQTAQLIERLAEAEKALEFYADVQVWEETPTTSNRIVCNQGDVEICVEPEYPDPFPCGGKRARDYFEKWRTGEKGE